MISRRRFLQTTAGAAVVTATNWPYQTLAGISQPRTGIHPDSPFQAVTTSSTGVTTINGYKFAKWFTGDHALTRGGLEHPPTPEALYIRPGSNPPAPSEETDFLVVGGGLAGLTAAYQLREHQPIVLEYAENFGGFAKGEIWEGVPYPLGSAYFITPDPGSTLDAFYSDLGLPDLIRADHKDFSAEYEGRIIQGFWDGSAGPPEEIPAWQQYQKILAYMGNVAYPDIPLSKDPAGAKAVIELDRQSFKENIQQQMGMPIPQLLEAAIQMYCYTSFAAGWEQISAAAGWNFLAAEPFGRWVLPGGNTKMAEILWQRVRKASGPERVRTRAMVVRMTIDKGGVNVTYVDRENHLHTIRAQKVIAANPKFLLSYMIPQMEKLDPEKSAAIDALVTRGYCVVNVLVNRPVDDFYDLFFLRDGFSPSTEPEAQDWSRPQDVINAHYPLGPSKERTVLTYWWGLPYWWGRVELLVADPFTFWAQKSSNFIRETLPILGLKDNDVEMVRMTAWGHPMPIPVPNLIADGHAEALRRPLADRIYFANQDNWALPAVENSVLDAIYYAEMAAATKRKQ